MLDDREQRALDATAALLAREDPELAARLHHHRLDARPPRRRPRTRARTLRSAAGRPLIMIAFCLGLLVLPALAVDARDRPPGGAPTSSVSIPTAPRDVPR